MIKLITIIVFTVTAYCDSSCGKASDHAAYGIMASGKQTYQGAIACPSWMPLGTILFVKSERFICEDRGGAIKGNRLDIWFPTCQEALEWGVQEMMGVAIAKGGQP